MPSAVLPLPSPGGYPFTLTPPLACLPLPLRPSRAEREIGSTAPTSVRPDPLSSAAGAPPPPYCLFRRQELAFSQYGRWRSLLAAGAGCTSSYAAYRVSFRNVPTSRRRRRTLWDVIVGFRVAHIFQILLLCFIVPNSFLFRKFSLMLAQMII